jgi:hypothetical protein
MEAACVAAVLLAIASTPAASAPLKKREKLLIVNLLAGCSGRIKADSESQCTFAA